jgi:hypothetical protein
MDFGTGLHGWGGGIVVGPRMLKFYRLSQSSRVAQGQVTAIHPEYHDTCDYAFQAASRFYQGTGEGCGQASIGAAVTIYFDAGDPTRSTNRNPSAALRNELMPFLSALILGPALFAFGMRRRSNPARKD